MGVSRRRVRTVVMLAAVAAAALLPSQAAAAAHDLLPDLRMARPVDLRITHETTAAGPHRRLLRFTARIVNIGEGPFIVRGHRSCATSACPLMTLVQRIRRSDGTVRVVPSVAKAKFDVGDGHNHWHVLHVERYELIPLLAGSATPRVRSAKVGFCFFDTTPWRLSLPGAPRSQVFGRAGCGLPQSTSIRMGLSVGWADEYSWFLARQWIDTTGLPHGNYLLCETADPNHNWVESNTHDNQAWAKVRLLRTAAGVETVLVLATGKTACAGQLPPA
jgi:hypothetical protein